MRRSSGRSIAVVGLAGGVLLLGLACAPTGASLVGRSVALLVGFALLTIGLLAVRLRAPWTPSSIAACFTVFGGFSAVLATTERDALGGSASFTYAVIATSLGGLCALAAACAFGAIGGERLPSPERLSGRRMRRVGAALVAVGFVGVAAALARFAIEELPTDDLGAAAKSFWIGNTWMLLVANAAVPGFGLWFAGLAGESTPIRGYLLPGVLVVAYALMLVPTSQRGFVIELAVIGTALLIARLGRRWWLGALVLAALVPFAIVTQAARNEINETGSLGLGSVVERLEPDRWSQLFGSQLASFRWTWDVAESRERIDAPNSFLQLALKPVPRRLVPDKSQGFGTEFTRALYPDAADDQVAFATPLVAESDYNGGLFGVAVALGLFGALAAFGELFVARGAPRAMRPVWAAVLLFAGFMVLRGDLANALVFSFSLTAPLVVASVLLGFRPLPRRDRLVVDALQVPRELSGVGAQVLRITEDLAPVLGERMEIRLTSDTYRALRDRLPRAATYRLSLRRSLPRSLRICYQQGLAPFLDARSSTLLCPGDQAPAWGRARVLLVVHDVRRLAISDAPFFERLFYRWIVPRGVRRAAAVVTVSEFSRQEIQRLVGVPTDRIHVVGHTMRSRPQVAGNPADGPLLLVGAVRPYKGVDTVVAAVEQLDEAARLEIVVAGSISDDEVVRKSRQTELGRWLRFEGWVDDEQLETLYRTAVGTICPSQYEGYGLAVAESIARGLPTIASDIPSHREIAGAAAMYFPPGDERALATCLRRVTDPSVRRDLAVLARRRAREIDHDPPAWGELIEDVLQAR
jgi:glycosyltransferase involved in cell wall biosynthesis